MLVKHAILSGIRRFGFGTKWLITPGTQIPNPDHKPRPRLRVVQAKTLLQADVLSRRCLWCTLSVVRIYVSFVFQPQRTLPRPLVIVMRTPTCHCHVHAHSNCYVSFWHIGHFSPSFRQKLDCIMILENTIWSFGSLGLEPNGCSKQILKFPNSDGKARYRQYIR